VESRPKDAHRCGRVSRKPVDNGIQVDRSIGAAGARQAERASEHRERITVGAVVATHDGDHPAGRRRLRPPRRRPMYDVTDWSDVDRAAQVFLSLDDLRR